MGQFHEGELELQRKTGEQEKAQRVGRNVQPFVAPAAQAFLAEQTLLLAATRDAEGQPWASMLLGPRGFVTCASDSEVTLNLSDVPQNEDVLWSQLAVGAQLGLLAIDFVARARFRINGSIARYAQGRVSLRVRESYSNCAKYIQSRDLTMLQPQPASESTLEQGQVLDASRLAALASADTFFIASGHADTGLDVSHRGGFPGFIQCLSDKTIRVPDYRGNGMYNTLGNIVRDARVGLMLLRYDCGRALQLIGNVELRLGEPDPDERSGGTGRFWDLALIGWREFALTTAQQDPGPVQFSRFNPGKNLVSTNMPG